MVRMARAVIERYEISHRSASSWSRGWAKDTGAQRSAKPPDLFRVGDVGALDGAIEPEFVRSEFFGVDGLAVGMGSAPSGQRTTL